MAKAFAVKSQFKKDINLQIHLRNERFQNRSFYLLYRKVCGSSEESVNTLRTQYLHIGIKSFLKNY